MSSWDFLFFSYEGKNSKLNLTKVRGKDEDGNELDINGVYELVYDEVDCDGVATTVPADQKHAYRLLDSTANRELRRRCDGNWEIYNGDTSTVIVESGMSATGKSLLLLFEYGVDTKKLNSRKLI